MSVDRYTKAVLTVIAACLSSPIAAQDVYRLSAQTTTAPKIVEMAKPRYLPMAVRKQIAGIVGLELDVLPDGTVGTVALVTSLDPEVDGMAAETARKFTFTPGTRNGKPVAVRIALDLEFNFSSDRARPAMRVLQDSLPAPK